jgi:hypothetical protein
LDLARTFPPEATDVASHLCRAPQSVFYRLLRPELLQRRKNLGLPPISPDAFTAWGGLNTADSRAHDAIAVEASRYLMERAIPAFAASFDRSCREDEAETKTKMAEANLAAVAATMSVGAIPPVSVRSQSSSSSSSHLQGNAARHYRLGEEVHKFGCNIRHLGLIRSHVRHRHARELLLHQMVARTLKNMLRRLLRNVARQQVATSSFGGNGSALGVPSTSAEDGDERVLHFFNCLVGSHVTDSAPFWYRVTRGVRRRFGDIAVKRRTLYGAIHSRALGDLVGYVSETTGVGVHLPDPLPKGYMFTRADLKERTVRTKRMGVIDWAAAHILVEQAQSLPAHDPQSQAASLRLLKMALVKYDLCLRADPLHVRWKEQARAVRWLVDHHETSRHPQTGRFVFPSTYPLTLESHASGSETSVSSPIGSGNLSPMSGDENTTVTAASTTTSTSTINGSSGGNGSNGLAMPRVTRHASSPSPHQFGQLSLSATASAPLPSFEYSSHDVVMFCDLLDLLTLTPILTAFYDGI